MILSEILKENTNISMATVDSEGRPKNRIFSHQFIVDGKICFATSNTSSAFAEITNNPYGEFTQFARAKYTRVGGKIIVAEGEEKATLKALVAEKNPKLISMYTEEGFEQKIEVCYFENPDVRVKDFKTFQMIDVEVK